MLANVAPYATAPALILVGSLMMTNVAKIDWRNPQKAIPAFLTIILMYEICSYWYWCTYMPLTQASALFHCIRRCCRYGTITINNYNL